MLETESKYLTEAEGALIKSVTIHPIQMLYSAPEDRRDVVRRGALKNENMVYGHRVNRSRGATFNLRLHMCSTHTTQPMWFRQKHREHLEGFAIAARV